MSRWVMEVLVPLSDEEQRLLEQMERALVEEDPKFASTLRGTRFARATRLQLVCASVAFLIGVAVLMSGVVITGTGRTTQAVLGVVGFVMMLGSATLGLSAWRGRQDSREQENRGEGGAPDGGTPGGLSLIQGGAAARKPRRTAKKSPRSSRSGSGSFMQRMEERWNKRRGQGF